MYTLRRSQVLVVVLLCSAIRVEADLAVGAIGTRPVGIQPLFIRGGADTVLSLPIQRTAVFKGYVTLGSASTLTVSTAEAAGTPQSPAWTENQFAYNAAGGQRETYYLEILSGSLAGVSFRIIGNDQSSLLLDTEGDDLTNYPKLGSVVPNDRVQIRPYWRIRDIFEIDGVPAIEARPNAFIVRDDILVPHYSDASVGINKAPNLFIHYVAGEGWRAAGLGAEDYADYVLPPNGVFIVRRRKSEDLTLWNVGPVASGRSVAFIPGGNGVASNDTYIALNHAVPVTLDSSGLRSADQSVSVIKDSVNDFARGDEVLAFPSGSAGSFNTPPSLIYYYKAGEGWKQVGANGTVGQAVTLEPGRGYIIRKKAANPGVDWLSAPQ